MNFMGDDLEVCSIQEGPEAKDQVQLPMNHDHWCYLNPLAVEECLPAQWTQTEIGTGRQNSQEDCNSKDQRIKD